MIAIEETNSETQQVTPNVNPDKTLGRLTLRQRVLEIRAKAKGAASTKKTSQAPKEDTSNKPRSHVNPREYYRGIGRLQLSRVTLAEVGLVDGEELTRNKIELIERMYQEVTDRLMLLKSYEQYVSGPATNILEGVRIFHKMLTEDIPQVNSASAILRSTDYAWVEFIRRYYVTTDAAERRIQMQDNHLAHLHWNLSELLFTADDVILLLERPWDRGEPLCP